MGREERITLDSRAQWRAQVLNRVLAGTWTQAEAAVALGRSVRQVRRPLRAYQARGLVALVHGNQGRSPRLRVPEPVRARIVALATGTYAGLNHTHLTEKLVEVERIAVGRTTVRRVLAGAGVASPRPRRAPRHRSRRARMGQEGMLLQADGSLHRWLGPEGPEWALVGGIDDATGTVPFALFREHEDAVGYLSWVRRVVETKGVPVALYVDRHGALAASSREPLSLEEQLAGGRLPTQVGRALAELGIRVVYARSPQAKGRVERLWGTFQDRLVSELRLARVTTLAQANAFVPTFLADFNQRFAVAPAEPGVAYRPAPASHVLNEICCFKYLRTVGADNVVSFGEHRLQVLPSATRRSYARARVEVQERLDGSLAVFAGEGPARHCVATRPAPAEASQLRPRRLLSRAPATPVLSLTPTTSPQRPAPPVAPSSTPHHQQQQQQHPWRIWRPPRPPRADVTPSPPTPHTP
jgi:hypothetical protein